MEYLGASVQAANPAAVHIPRQEADAQLAVLGQGLHARDQHLALLLVGRGLPAVCDVIQQLRMPEPAGAGMVSISRSCLWGVACQPFMMSSSSSACPNLQAQGGWLVVGGPLSGGSGGVAGVGKVACWWGLACVGLEWQGGLLSLSWTCH